ncbi:MAG: CRTAC1 family protein [Acidobacteria bacterium]|nr:CRTAC1 family protein [Acidobacteriota bacterium]
MCHYRRFAVLPSSALLLLALAPPRISFTDVSQSWSLRPTIIYGAIDNKQFLIESTGVGAAIFDYDQDGKNDLLVLQGSRLGSPPNSIPSVLLFHNEGNGKFQETAQQAGLTASGWAQGVCAGDYDNDGFPDLLITFYGVTRLFHNDHGRFSDDTPRSGLPTSSNRWGAGCAFTDYDRDGLLDIFVSNYVDFDLRTAPKPGSLPECIWKDLPIMCGPKGLPMAHNALYRNLGNRRFEDVSAKAGILKPGGRYGLGVAAADFNNDGWPDIYVACDQTPSLLYQNQKNGVFVERAVEAGVAFDRNGRTQAGMGVAIGDFDSNGLLDIAKTNFSGELPSLYLNEDGEFFRDTAESAGLGVNLFLGWGIAFLDVDEDTHPDLILANGHFYPEVEQAQLADRYRQPTLLYRNNGNGRFTDITKQAGPALSTPKASRGLAIGDLDGDARPEIVIVNMNEPLTILQNQTPRANWTRLRFTGKRSNRSAIGTRVTLQSTGRTQTAELIGGGSYFSQNELALYFGLHTATRIDKLTIRWPLGKIQECRNLPINQTLSFTEDEACVAP